jgi:hypothetical protein
VDGLLQLVVEGRLGLVDCGSHRADESAPCESESDHRRI